MTTRRTSLGLFVIAMSIAMSAAALAQTSKKAARLGAKKDVVEALGAAGGVKFSPGNRPDPFYNPNLTKKKTAADPNEEEPRGQAPPGIAGMYIAQVKLLGTVYGEGTPTAVFLGTDQRSYFLQESDRLFDGYVKKIREDSVLLIRETKYRSGKISTQEVIKRLRTP